MKVRNPNQRLETIYFGLLMYLLAVSWRVERFYLSIFECGMLLLVCVWLVRTARGEARLAVHPVVAAMLLLPCIGALQIATGVSIYPWRTANATLETGTYAAAGWLGYRFAQRMGFPARFRRVLIFTALGVAVVSLLHWYTSPGQLLWWWPNPYALRTPFPLLNHSHFAALMELAAAAAIWEAMRGRGSYPLYTWAAAIMAGAVWAAGSRSGSVIVTAELAGALWLSVRGKPAKSFFRRRALVIAMPVVLMIAGIGWQGLVERVSGQSQDNLRPIFARATWEMVKARPWEGFGLGTWETVYPAYMETDTGYYVEHAHNDWLEWMSEGGVLYAAAMLFSAIWAVRRAGWQPWCLGVVGVFLQAIVEFPLHKPAVAAWQFAMLGCLAGSRDSQDMEVRPSDV